VIALLASCASAYRARPALLLRALALAGVISACAVACGDESTSDDPTTSATSAITPAPIPHRSPTELELPIQVAVTLPLFREFAEAAGPENVEAISLIPSGADPHSYEFTPADLERMKGIDFFFFNGLGLDSRLQDTIETNRDENAFVIPFAPNIRSPQGGDATAEQAGDNAHLWLDPSLAYVYTEIVADELVIYDGIRQQFYASSFTAYRDSLLSLQAELEAELEGIAPERRKLVTMHNSFDHFARRFKLTVAGFGTSDPAPELSDADTQRLVQLLREQQVPAVFAEFGYDESGMAGVANQAGVPLCTLYSDILPDGMAYEAMMRANVQELVRCLGG
jgi:ABC-type Zn uptake system ZnuABC Zn-binding protein ZnuA